MKKKIQEFFTICTPEIELAVDLITGIYESKEVSSTTLSRYVRGEADVSSKQRRIERFYSKGYVDTGSLLDATRKMFGEQRFVLSLDRTNWKFGKQSINAFAAFASSGDIGGMINLKMLDNKGGNSTSEDRIAIVISIIEQYGKDKISSILGDREFFSLKFAAWLRREEVSFAIRVRENLEFVQPYLREATGKSKLFKNVIVGIDEGIEVSCDLSIKKLNNEYLIIASSGVERPLEKYRKRWGIERFFKMLKTGGFNIENTKITDPNRLEVLLLLCGIAYLLCVKIGVYRHYKVQKIRRKKKNECYEYSYFRWGLDWLKELLLYDIPDLLSLITTVFAHV